MRNTHCLCMFGTDFSLSKCPHLTVGRSGRCLELWTLCSAETLSVSSQKPSPSDTTSDLDLAVRQDMHAFWILKTPFGLLMPQGITQHAASTVSLSLGSTGGVLFLLASLEPLLDLRHAKSWKYKFAVINLFANSMQGVETCNWDYCIVYNIYYVILYVYCTIVYKHSIGQCHAVFPLNVVFVTVC